MDIFGAFFVMRGCISMKLRGEEGLETSGGALVSAFEHSSYFEVILEHCCFLLSHSAFA